VGELKQRVIVLAGAALLGVVGRDRFYPMAQDRPNVLGRLAAAFCSGHAGRLGQNYRLSDPVTFGNTHTRDPQPRSRHMDQYMWWHNYFGDLRAARFRVEHFETRRFDCSWSRGARVVIVDGSRGRER
jgi:hypothetical protein